MTTTPPAPTADSPLVMRRVTTPDDENIERVLHLSNVIFSADESTKHGSLPYWRNCLLHPASFIIYLTPISPGSDNPVAFIFVIHRKHDRPLKNGATHSTHVWLAGVSPERRRAGCLARMMHEVDNIRPLTICTHPSRYPMMWSWLNRRGWPQEREFADGKVMFSKTEH
ncbi:hypothetical protein C2E23DRAFT_807413 [Lenzites betulinus]|nr:hypothetical protein C2E23DRAFT_807413 [Lenzites betulinus]